MMCMTLDGLPAGLDLDGIRQPHSHPWVSDRTVIGPDGKAFCAAFDIVEVSMMNYMAGVAWGYIGHAGKPLVSGHLPAWSVCCWSPQFCSWVTPQVFVLKLSDKQAGWPLIAVHIEQGVQNLGRNCLASRPANISIRDIAQDRWTKRFPQFGR